MIVIMNMFNEEIDISRNMIILNVIFILNVFADMCIVTFQKVLVKIKHFNEIFFVRCS